MMSNHILEEGDRSKTRDEGDQKNPVQVDINQYQHLKSAECRDPVGSRWRSARALMRNRDRMWFRENVERIDRRFVDKARGDSDAATGLRQDKQLSEADLGSPALDAPADRDVIVPPDLRQGEPNDRELYTLLDSKVVLLVRQTGTRGANR
jgi:hypothetical protein